MDTATPPPLPPARRRRELSTGQIIALSLLCVVGGVVLAVSVLWAGCVLILNGGMGG